MAVKKKAVKKGTVTDKDVFMYLITFYTGHTKEMRVAGGSRSKHPASLDECVSNPKLCETSKICLCIDEEQLATMYFKTGYPVRFDSAFDGYRVAAGDETHAAAIGSTLESVACRDYTKTPRLFSTVVRKNVFSWFAISKGAKKDPEELIRLLPLIESINQDCTISGRDTFAFLCLYGEDRKKCCYAFLIELAWRICQTDIGSDLKKRKQVLDAAENFLIRMNELQNEDKRKTFYSRLSVNANEIKKSFDSEERSEKERKKSGSGSGSPSDKSAGDVLKAFVCSIEREAAEKRQVFAYRTAARLTLREQRFLTNGKAYIVMPHLNFDNHMFHLRVILTLLTKRFNLEVGEMFRSQILVDKSEQRLFTMRHNIFSDIEDKLKGESPDDGVAEIDKTFKSKLNDVLLGTFPMADVSGRGYL